MPCNTAHLYFEELQRSLSIPILNIVDETLQAIPENTKESLFSQQKQLFKLGPRWDCKTEYRIHSL